MKAALIRAIGAVPEGDVALDVGYSVSASGSSLATMPRRQYS